MDTLTNLKHMLHVTLHVPADRMSYKNCLILRGHNKHRSVAPTCLAPRVGLEPTTNSLTGSCSTIELPRNMSNRKTIPNFMDFVISRMRPESQSSRSSLTRGAQSWREPEESLFWPACAEASAGRSGNTGC